jgi:DNA-binding MarR family transcriptional regulator
VSNAISDRVARVYKARFGLKIPEWRVVAVVAERAAVTQAGLCEATAMDKMTVSRAVTGLLARGLLRHSSGADRRTRMLALTAEGQALYDEVAPMALAIEAEVLAGFSADERAALMAFLARLEGCEKS